MNTDASPAAARITARPRLLIPVGIPGSGKSNWAMSLDITDRQMISSDAIRLRLTGSLQAANQPARQAMLNELVFTIFNCEIRESLASGKTVIADATNLRPESREQLLSIAEATGAEAYAFLFDDLDRARIQNRKRAEDAVVPEAVIDEMTGLYLQAKAEIENDRRYTSVSYVS